MAGVFQNIAVSVFFKGPSGAPNKEDAINNDAPPSYNGLTYIPPDPAAVAAARRPPRPPPPPHPNAGLPRRFPWRDVLIQLFALAVSAFALAMTAFVVWVFDDNPAQTFHTNVVSGWYESITLNSVLAWMAAVAKVTLMVPIAECIGQLRWILFGARQRKLSDLDYIDGASRDVFGAIGWIFRFRRGLLVHFGAALMIVSIGFDPAIQQLISYELRSVADTTQTALLAANPSYTPTRGFSRGLILATPRALLWGATSSVLGAPVTTAHTCTSANCTFPLATSVGVCSACTDITAQLSRNCTTLSATNKFCQSADCFTSGQLCTYTYNGTTVGGGTIFLDVLAAGANSTTQGGSVSIPAERIVLTALYIQPDNATAATQDLPVAPGHVPAGGAHVARGYTCALSFCEQKYTGAVLNGSYTETLHNSSSVDSFVMPIPALSDITDALLNRALPVAPSGETNVSIAALFAMSNGLPLALTGNATVPTETPRPGDISELHRGLYEDLLTADFAAVVANMTASMSAAVRNEGGGGGMNGTTFVVESYTRAHWAWFAYPAAVWVLAAVLLAAVVLRTRKDRGSWLGNSQVAGVLVGLQEGVRREVDVGGAVVRRDEMGGNLGSWRNAVSVRRVAEDIKVQTGVVDEGGVLAMRFRRE